MGTSSCTSLVDKDTRGPRQVSWTSSNEKMKVWDRMWLDSIGKPFWLAKPMTMSWSWPLLMDSSMRNSFSPSTRTTQRQRRTCYIELLSIRMLNMPWYLEWANRRKGKDRTTPVRMVEGSQTSDKRENSRSRPPSKRMTNFTPLNTPLKHVLMQVSDHSALRWSDKLKSDPNKCLRDKYCRFHWDHGYNTSECYDLKQKI